MADDKKLELKKVLNTLDPDRLTKEDFEAALGEVVTYINDFSEGLTSALESLSTAIPETAESLRGESATEREGFKAEAQSIFKALSDGTSSRLDEIAAKTEERLRAVKDGQDADPQEVKRLVMAEIVLPEAKEAINDSPEDIRNKLELLQGEERLDASAIKGLRTTLKKLNTSLSSLSGTMALSVGHWPRHEAFTMDGIATSVSLTEGGVGAGGTALIVRYQGQTLDLTSQYTVNGNKITFIGFTPESGTIISITYWP